MNLWPRFIIKKGLVAKCGQIIGRQQYFGDDFLLTSYYRPYVVRALTYLECFQLEKSVVDKLFQYCQFPRLLVRVAQDFCVAPLALARHRLLVCARVLHSLLSAHTLPSPCLLPCCSEV